MSDKEIIEMLMKQNERLMQIIENYSKQETKVINDIKVNSYNGSQATAENGHTDNNIKSARNVTGSGDVKDTNFNNNGI